MPAGCCWQCGKKVRRGAAICARCGAAQTRTASTSTSGTTDSDVPRAAFPSTVRVEMCRPGGSPTYAFPPEPYPLARATLPSLTMPSTSAEFLHAEQAVDEPPLRASQRSERNQGSDSSRPRILRGNHRPNSARCPPHPVISKAAALGGMCLVRVVSPSRLVIKKERRSLRVWGLPSGTHSI